MSHSKRAQERRRQRSKMSKHERLAMAQQHWGNTMAMIRAAQKSRSNNRDRYPGQGG